MQIPIYKATITDYYDGVNCISFVKEPAVESGFLKFDKQRKPLKFSVIDEQSRKVIAPIMRCNFPIYRFDDYHGEYFIVYTKEVIEVMARKMFDDYLVKNMNIEHNQQRVLDGVHLEQLFIKNPDKGINPVGFEDIENYSLFGVYTINNSAVWESIENGTFTGVSIEGNFTLEPSEDNEVAIWEDIYSMLKQLSKTN